MFKLFKHLTTREYIYMIISVVFIVLQVWLNFKIPEYTATIINIATSGSAELKEIVEPALIMLLATLGTATTAVITGFLIAKIAAAYSTLTRERVYSQILTYSPNELNGFSTPSLITRTTNDISQTQFFVSFGFQLVIQAPIMAIWGILKISKSGSQWPIATLIAVIILVSFIIVIILIVLPKFKLVQTQTDEVNKVSREGLSGSRIVRAYNAETYQEARFDKENVLLSKIQLFTRRVLTLLNPFMQIVMNGLILVFYFLAAKQIQENFASVDPNFFGELTMLVQYSMQIIMSFIMMTMILFIYPRASVSAKRINEVLETKSTILDGEISNYNEPIDTIEFKNVSFKYPNAEEYILRNINLKINKGETVAFLGSTGSGKSTLINLLPRFYDVSEGEILINGINIKSFKLKELYNHIAYVPQKAFLFKGTINSNLTFGNIKDEFNEEELAHAANIAQASEFINELEEGYESPVSQSATNLSGGQKQRVAIARAIARNSDIIIFDDSFSALDFKTDKLLRTALKEQKTDTTKLIVAQRIGTIMDADRIVVLDKGVIVGNGTHKELLKTSDVYYEIASSQFSKEELENDETSN